MTRDDVSAGRSASSSELPGETVLRLPLGPIPTVGLPAKRPVARRSVGHWRWHLDHHIGREETNVPDFCELCWNGASYEQPWRPLGFVMPGAVA